MAGVPREVVDRHWGPLGRVLHGPLGGLVGDDLRKAAASWPG